MQRRVQQSNDNLSVEHHAEYVLELQLVHGQHFRQALLAIAHVVAKNHLAKQVDADVLAEHELHLAHPDALHSACCTLKLSKQTYRSQVAHTTYVNLRTSYPMKQTKIRSPT